MAQQGLAVMMETENTLLKALQSIGSRGIHDRPILEGDAVRIETAKNCFKRYFWLDNQQQNYFNPENVE